MQEKADCPHVDFPGNNAGFTLIELMISSVISLAIIGGGVAFYLSMQGVLVKEDKSNVTQRNARVAMSAVINIIRRAGSNPADIAGFQAFANNPSPTSMIVYSDNNGDQDTDDMNEQVTINFSGTPQHELTLKRENDNHTQTFHNIESATFTYLDSSNVTTATWSEVKVLEIAITPTKGDCSSAILSPGQVANCTAATEMVSQVRPWNLNLL